MKTTHRERRTFLLGAGAAVVAAALAPARAAGAKKGAKDKDKDEGEEDIGPGEDLMREHGVLRRVLLVYREIARRLEAGPAFDPTALQRSAKIVRRSSRTITSGRRRRSCSRASSARTCSSTWWACCARSTRRGARSPSGSRGGAPRRRRSRTRPPRRLRADLLAFVRMYEPHAAREDTVLFPALHRIVSRSEYDALGEDFERREHQTFGEGGFEHAVASIDEIEKTLGIEDLAQFTPKA